MDFYQQGQDWFSDRYDAVVVMRNRYLLMLIIACVIIVAQLFAMLRLFPLKQAVPYIIQLANHVPSVLQPADLTTLQRDKKLTVYFLYQYLTARMTYAWDFRQRNADIVRALSNKASYSAYAKFMDIKNLQSPIQLHGKKANIKVKILGHSFPYPDLAEVRFTTQVVPKSGKAKPAQHWLATLKYTYADAKLSLLDRERVNPVGFFVTDFQVNRLQAG